MATASYRGSESDSADSARSDLDMDKEFPSLPILPLHAKRVQSSEERVQSTCPQRERPTQEEDDRSLIGYDDPDYIRIRELQDIELIRKRAASELKAVQDQRAVRDRRPLPPVRKS